MHGTGGHRLTYKEVVEVGSNFKNSYFWWFGSDSTGSIRLCVWSKSRELGGMGSSRFPTSTMQSFSTDLLPGIKSYWAESDLELFILLRLNPGARGEHPACLFLFESIWSVFKMIGLIIWFVDGLLQVCWVGVGVSSLGSWSYSKGRVCN